MCDRTANQRSRVRDRRRRVQEQVYGRPDLREQRSDSTVAERRSHLLGLRENRIGR